MKARYALFCGVLLAVSVASQAATITFDEAGIGSSPNNFYNGGGGPNLGASFLANDWMVLGGFGETSPPNFAFSISGTGYMTVTGGFTGQFSFTYGAFATTTVTVFEGVDGTGAALASATLLANDPSSFDLTSISFTGIGRSVTVSGGEAQFGWDDVTFSLNNTVPEPGSLALVLSSLGLIGLVSRRRDRKSSS